MGRCEPMPEPTAYPAIAAAAAFRAMRCVQTESTDKRQRQTPQAWRRSQDLHPARIETTARLTAREGWPDLHGKIVASRKPHAGSFPHGGLSNKAPHPTQSPHSLVPEPPIVSRRERSPQKNTTTRRGMCAGQRRWDGREDVPSAPVAPHVPSLRRKVVWLSSSQLWSQ